MRESWIKYFVFQGLRKRHRKSTHYSDCRNIGFVFTGQEESLILKDLLLKFFERDGKYVSCLEFRAGAPAPAEEEGVCFAGDFTFFGKLKNPYASSFLATPFDYLFCLDKNLSPALRYFMTHSQAHCRVGVAEEKPFFDIIFLSKEKNETGNDIYNYIKKVN